MTFKNSKIFLTQICKELNASIAYFCSDSSGDFCLIVKKNSGDKKKNIKKVMFGEQDQNKDLLNDLLPEIIDMIKTQGW